MELVKAVARRHGPKTLWTDGINRPIRIGPVVESRKVRACCRHFQVLEDLPVSLAQVAPYCAISIQVILSPYLRSTAWQEMRVWAGLRV